MVFYSMTQRHTGYTRTDTRFPYTTLFRYAGWDALTLSMVTHAQATGNRPLLRDSFRIGSEGGALCQAQSATGDPAARTMFDRAWTLVCRDAARPVGQIYALRRGAATDDGALQDRLAASRREAVECNAPDRQSGG